MNNSPLSEAIIGCAIRVHNNLGPGLLESVYEACLYHELVKAGHRVERQKLLPLIYEGMRIEAAYRADLVVDDAVILELKSVDQLHPIFAAQLFTYLKLSGCTLGLLINFNVPLLKQGIKRVVCGYVDPPQMFSAAPR